VGHTGRMTRGLALVALVLTLAPAGAAADQSTPRRATLHVGLGVPLVVRGAHFVPGEQVSVTIAAARKRTKRTVANSRGGFVVRFRASFERCRAGFIALAVGDRGSRALVKRPPMLCPPRL
jgi:hypothetical protein